MNLHIVNSFMSLFLGKYFENVCKLDIRFNLEKVHFVLDEIVMNGGIFETNKAIILSLILETDKKKLLLIYIIKFFKLIINIAFYYKFLKKF